jgi:hypothetical protein
MKKYSNRADYFFVSLFWAPQALRHSFGIFLARQLRFTLAQARNALSWIEGCTHLGCAPRSIGVTFVKRR